MTRVEEITKVVETILNQEVDEEETESRGHILAVFFMAALEEGDDIMQDLALMLGADIAKHGVGLLKNAIVKGDLERIDFLIKSGAKITAKDDWGNENWAIELASDVGDNEVVMFLIENGVDITANDNAAIKQASMRGHIDTIELLLENGADASAGLSEAAENGLKEVVEFLIKNGADVTVNNNCAVKEAFLGRYKEIVEILIKAGASFS